MQTLSETLASYVPGHIARRATDPTLRQVPAAEVFSAAVLHADISGFTPLSERMAERGPGGVEELSRMLNDFFGRLIDLIARHGGDVAKFAGDAITAFWSASDAPGALADATRRAAACGRDIQDALRGYGTTDARLVARISIGAGEATSLHLGGVEGRRECLLAGDAMFQTTVSDPLARPGEVTLSPEAQAVVGFDLGTLPPPLAELPPFVFAPAPAGDGVECDDWQSYIPMTVRSRVAAGQTEWLGELRRLTVLFIGLPDVLHRLPLHEIHRLLCAVQTELYHYEASLNKIVVDGQGAVIVAALGLPPLAHEDDVDRGVQVALAVHDRVSALGGHAAVGLATGRAFCGVVGNARRREYTMIGDVVNLAARLMQTARDGTESPPILCDQRTYEGLRPGRHFTALPPLVVKGKVAPIAVYRPRPEAPGDGHGAPIARAQTEMVGRLRERGLLAEALEVLGRGESAGTVVIEGEAGIGKSRLVDDAQRQARGQGLAVYCGAGDSIEKAVAYHGWRGVFTELFGLDSVPDADARRGRVEAALGAAHQARAPLLNTLLPLDFPETDLTRDLNGPDRTENLRDLLVTLIGEAAARRPLVIVLEDGHWLDSASWALALEVSRRVRPLLLLISTRPLAEQPPPECAVLLDMPGTTRLHLQPLAAEESLALVCRCLGVSELPAPVAALIREKAGGHPFFSEELAYALRDRGLIVITDGGCRPVPGVDWKTVALPDTLEGVITSRIDRLTPQQQMALKVASVIGNAFALRLLRAIHPIDADRPHLPGYLQTLERVDLTLREAVEPDLSYLFKHMITRDVAYNLLLFVHRRELHRAVAEWYEWSYADDLSPYYAILAYHYVKAEVTAQAVDYLEKAAVQALSNGMPREAVDLGLEAARMLGVNLPTDPRQIGPMIGAEMATVSRLMAGRRPAELLDLPPLSDPSIARAIGLLLQIIPAAHISLQPELFALMSHKTLTLTLEHGQNALAPGVYSMYSIICQHLTGDYRMAHEFSQLALDLDVRQGRRQAPTVMFLHGWFNNHWVNPLETSLDLTLQASRAGFEAGDVMYGCMGLSAHCVYLAALGGPLAAVEESARRALDRISGRVAISAFHCRLEMQFAKALAGRTLHPLSLTDTEHDEARDLASICDTHNVNQIPYFFTTKMRLSYYYGDRAEALRHADRARPLLRAVQGQVGEIEFVFFHALTLLMDRRDEPASVEDVRVELAEAKRLIEKMAEWSTLCPANFEHKWLLARAELARAEGGDQEAVRLYAEAAESAQQAGYTPHAALAHELAGRHRRALGDAKGAIAHLRDARDGYGRWGAWAKVRDLNERYPEIK